MQDLTLTDSQLGQLVILKILCANQTLKLEPKKYLCILNPSHKEY